MLHKLTLIGSLLFFGKFAYAKQCCDDSDCESGEYCDKTIVDDYQQGTCKPVAFNRFEKALIAHRFASTMCASDGERCTSVRDCCADVEQEIVCCLAGQCASDKACLL